MSSHSRLVLEDGTEYEGIPFGGAAPVSGEVVFNTGMVGYPEALTDPSYRGQILVLTYPLVGNYGVPARERDAYGLPLHFESERIQVAGLIVAEHAEAFSHYTAKQSLHAWLAEEGVPGLSGVDTRALTKRLRERGTMLGNILSGEDQLPFTDPNATDLVSLVSVDEVQALPCPSENGSLETPEVLLLDCGCKTNIMRNLIRRGLKVIRSPYDHYFLNMNYDALVISSGPGDPKMCTPAIRNVARALAIGKPILGICLGHQILALAVGADTYKLRFGHRSQNQPCVERSKGAGSDGSGGRCFITSQNHGYAVRESGLPSDWEVWFANANDGTVEGIRHISRHFRGVQFHPEASPGPVDTAWIFDEFVEEVKRSR